MALLQFACWNEVIKKVYNEYVDCFWQGLDAEVGYWEICGCFCENDKFKYFEIFSILRVLAESKMTIISFSK